MLTFSVLLYVVLVFFSYQLLKSSFKKNEKYDIFNPANMFFLWFFLEIPFLFLASFDPSLIHTVITLGIYDYTPAFISHLYYNLLYILTFTFVGYFINSKKIINLVDHSLTSKPQMSWSFFWTVGFFSYLYFLSSIGGLSYLWQNMVNRTEITGGTGYISTLYNLAFIISAVLMIQERNFSKLKLLAMLMIFFAMASTGGRGSLLSLIIIIMLASNYTCNLLRFRVTLKLIFIILLCFVFFLAIPLFRKADAFEFYQSNPLELVEDITNNISHLFSRFSTLERNMVVFDKFSLDNLWGGASYIDLLTAPIPRTMYLEKPPVDEGVYISSIAHGFDVSPPTSATKMLAVAWPLTNITVGFVNFGFVGVVFFGALYSFFYNVIYRKLLMSPSDFYIIIYGFLCLNQLGFTNLKIIKLITFFVIYFVFFSLFKFIQRLRT
ncbi:hypothetical protein [Vibrio breoganii]|uniref:hypothetical protein n=1 Tax=Vibrio breoganii TaxID=553239 RepID=UPI000C82E1B9|nr:hypothetical protein [Vibrio breoganii]PMO79408.1 hypothetical protein BCT00_01065 [Vibrio breoganii]